MSGTAADLLHFVNSSPTPFHLVSHAEQILLAAGFTKESRAHTRMQL
jgi:aspartyl aminopeptidase